MLSSLSEVANILLCVQCLYLVYSCHRMQFHRQEITKSANGHIHGFKEDIEEVGALLSEIADILDSSPKSANPIPSDKSGNSITDFIISMAANRLSSGLDGSTEKTDSQREILQTENPQVEEKDIQSD